MLAVPFGAYSLEAPPSFDTRSSPQQKLQRQKLRQAEAHTITWSLGAPPPLPSGLNKFTGPEKTSLGGIQKTRGVGGVKEKCKIKMLNRLYCSSGWMVKLQKSRSRKEEKQGLLQQAAAGPVGLVARLGRHTAVVAYQHRHLMTATLSQ